MERIDRRARLTVREFHTQLLDMTAEHLGDVESTITLTSRDGEPLARFEPERALLAPELLDYRVFVPISAFDTSVGGIWTGSDSHVRPIPSAVRGDGTIAPSVSWPFVHAAIAAIAWLKALLSVRRSCRPTRVLRNVRDRPTSEHPTDKNQTARRSKPSITVDHEKASTSVTLDTTSAGGLLPTCQPPTC